MKVIGVTFATADFAWSAEVARHSALTVGRLHQFLVYTPKDIQNFCDRHPALFKSHSRGFGFWSWKPEVILKALTEVAADGDVVVYVDAGLSFTNDIRPYTDVIMGLDALLFHVGECEAKGYFQTRYCKTDTFHRMGTTPSAFEGVRQLGANLQMYRKTAASVGFVTRLRNYCVDIGCVDDVCRDHANPSDYVDHRHDQSVLTILAHSNNTMSHLVARCASQYGVNDRDPHGLDLPTIVNEHRKRYRALPTVTVITPTVGGPHLEDCIYSVQQQDTPCVKHLVVIDGPEHRHGVMSTVSLFVNRVPIEVLQLPFNVGANGWNGHRAYAAASFLADTDYVCFLDDDNVLKPHHVSALVRTVLVNRQRWTYCLREIIRSDGTWVCNDDCESLGCLSPSVLHPDDYFVDTNCHLLQTSLAVKVAPQWYSRFRDPHLGEADRNLTRELLRVCGPVTCVKDHTVSYRVDSTARSVSERFFLEGNALTRYRFGPDTRDVYVFHFSPGATSLLFDTMRDPDGHAFDEWQLTQLCDLRSQVNLVDGFTSLPHIPPNAVALINMCHPGELPLEWLRERHDVFKICYTLESPNYRHWRQWEMSFLKAHFDHLLTYWAPLLAEHPDYTTYCPHNTHWLADNHIDRHLPQNVSTGKTVCCVLENRPGLNRYAIDGREMRQLDGLRQHYVEDLDIDLFGMGWGAELGTRARVIRSNRKDQDVEHAVDIYRRYAFAVVVENCDAAGYVSEKLRDCFVAGCIPIYYGNNNERVGIPKEMYVDLKLFSTSADLKRFLDHMTDDDVQTYRRQVLGGRNAVLKKVSTQEFSRCFQQAHDVRGSTMP